MQTWKQPRFPGKTPGSLPAEPQARWLFTVPAAEAVLGLMGLVVL